jgi:hypothetical protein
MEMGVIYAATTACTGKGTVLETHRVADFSESMS